MRICPKCSAYYASDSSGFCLADGIPLVNVDPDTEKWNEGSRVIEEKAKGLSKQRRILKWRRIVLGGMTALILTMVVAKSFTTKTTTPPLINGRVTFKGQGLGGVNIIMLDGTKATSRTTDENGNYTFSQLRTGGNYTITPNWQSPLTPPSRSFNNLQHNESADFAVEVFKISGRVMSLTGPLNNIKISLENSKLATTMTETTDTNGYYAFNDLPAGGTYTVTPQAQLKFLKPNRVFEDLRHDETADFTVKTELFKISGHVMSLAGPLAKIKISLEGSKLTSTRTETTKADGSYAFNELPAGGSYTVTPQADLKFKLPSRPFPNLQHDERADFTVKTEVYKISGRVTPNQHPWTVEMELEGSKHHLTKADANGNYSFSDLQAGGTYTVTLRRVKDRLVAEGGLLVSPPRYYFENLRRDEESADFKLSERISECSREDMKRQEDNVVQERASEWEKLFRGESESVIKETVPLGGLEGRAAPGKRIGYEFNFLEPCKVLVVNATFSWEVSWWENSGEKTRTVYKNKSFRCDKTALGWNCPTPRSRSLRFAPRKSL